MFHCKYARQRQLDSRFFFLTSWGARQVAPTSTLGPVGCGTPPGGSTVTANAFASELAGSCASHTAPMEWDPFSITPALIGAPVAGSNHIW
jgi:hypothetical protein